MIVLAHAQALVDEYIVNKNDTKLKAARDQRTDGRTAHAQLGRAEVTLDEHIVDRAVGHQRDRRHDGRNANDLHRAQQSQKGSADAEQQIGPAHDREVLHALLNDIGRLRKQPHDLIGEQTGEHEEQQSKERACAKRGLAQLLDGSGAPLSPVLAAHGHQRVAHADGQLLEQKLQGVDSRHARKRGFAVTADHQIVRQVDAEHNRVLQHDHKKQPPERAVKAFISCQQHACPPSSFFGKSDTIIVSHPQDFVKGIC